MFNLVSITKSKSKPVSSFDHKQDGLTKSQKAKALAEAEGKKFKKGKGKAKKVKSSKTVQASLPPQQPTQQKQSSVSAIIPTRSGALSALVVSSPSQQLPPSTPSPAPLKEIKQQSANLYYADLPLEERVAKLLQDGCTNEQIAMRLDVSLSTVLKTRKTVSTKSLIKSPRDLFASRLTDFNDAFDTAKSNFYDDPTSEVNYKIMTEFAKTMRELVKDFNELEDPKELAQQIIMQALRPVIMKTLKSVVDSMNTTLKSTLPFLGVQEKVLLSDGIKNGVKSLQDAINADYNKSVGILEQIFNIDLTDMKLQGKERYNNAEPVQDDK